MKKIISLLLVIAAMLAVLTSCASKVKIKDGVEVALAYDHDGTTVTSTLTGINASLVIDNLNGRKITKEAPEGANYVEGVYFMVDDQFYHVDLNGSPVFMIGDKEGYVELEQYRFDALVSLFSQFGVYF
jgi:hypothetical protein